MEVEEKPRRGVKSKGHYHQKIIARNYAIKFYPDFPETG
jgi:hypothetical protein